MSTPKRGPIKIDLTGLDGKRKLDVEWNQLAQKFIVKVRGGKTFRWTATQFATFFRKWLLRQREKPVSGVESTSAGERIYSAAQGQDREACSSIPACLPRGRISFLMLQYLLEKRLKQE